MATGTSRIDAYFSHIVSALEPNREVRCVAVAHMVPNTLNFVPALNSLMTLSAVLAKPKSVNRPEFNELKKLGYEMPPLSREWAANASKVVEYLFSRGLAGKEVVFVDIGGYFAESIAEIAGRFDGKILGVMEGTENGAVRYEKALGNKVPIITVARSPLKLPEDYLVGSSVVFSVEAVLRQEAEILQTRTAAVIGYGRVGSAVAHILRARGINTVIYDKDPVKLAEAAARGFQANVQLEGALRQSSLVISATGNKALNLRGFGMLQSGCVVASVTSADDEFDLSELSKGYDKSSVGEHIVKYQENRPGNRHFFMISDGNAANFIHGAVIGPAIQLIEGEKLKALRVLMSGKTPARGRNLLELNDADRRQVAEIWIEHFL